METYLFNEIKWDFFQTVVVSVAERTSYFCWRVNWFDRYGRRIFSPYADDLSYSTLTIFPGNIKMVKTRQTISSSGPFEQDGRTFCPLPLIAAESQYHEESRLIYGPFESTLSDQGFPVEHGLDAFNLPLTGTRLYHL